MWPFLGGPPRLAEYALARSSKKSGQASIGVKPFHLIGMLHICSDLELAQRGSCRFILPSTSKKKGNDLILLFECVYEQIDSFIAESWHTHLVAKHKEFR